MFAMRGVGGELDANSKGDELITVILFTCAVGLDPHMCNAQTAVETKPVEVTAMNCVYADMIAQRAAALDPRNANGQRIYYKLSCRPK